jgi:uncharacterized membrane protein YvbJ
MTYCRKCGAKLDEDAKFCRVCGTPVAPVPVTTATRPMAPKRRGPSYLLPVIILVGVLLTAIVISALLFLPVYPVAFNQTDKVPKASVDTVLMDLQVDVANVNISFKNLPNSMVMLNVTADGNVGILDNPDSAVNVTFNHQTANNSEVVIASVLRVSRWSISYGLNVNCDVYVDPSVNLSLNVRSSVGNIVMNADAKTVLQNIDLETTTGSVDVSLSKNVVVANSISLTSTTGTVQFDMNNADVSDNVSVNLKSTTGLVNVDLAATQNLSGNVTVNARTTTGSVNLSMEIDNNVGGRIESHTDIGRITVDVQKFSGNQTPLQSNNYPAGSNFLADVRTTTGGINICAAYGSSAILS